MFEVSQSLLERDGPEGKVSVKHDHVGALFMSEIACIGSEIEAGWAECIDRCDNLPSFLLALESADPE